MSGIQSSVIDLNHFDFSSFVFQVERMYHCLVSAVGPAGGQSAEPTLGGKLLYAGELDGEGRALISAASIAGAASLAVARDRAAQRQAIRDGVADFLVTSLDEALRILKNEIRKRATVAVCVGLVHEASASEFAGEMLERGVLPDLMARAAAEGPEGARFVEQGARLVECGHVPDSDDALLAWRVSSAPALWLPRLDELAAVCLQPKDGASRRWLRLSPRYLGRAAQNLRLLRCSERQAARCLENVRTRVESGEIGVEVEMRLDYSGEVNSYCFSPSMRRF